MACACKCFTTASVLSCTWILYRCTGWRPVIGLEGMKKKTGNGRRIRRSFFDFFEDAPAE